MQYTPDAGLNRDVNGVGKIGREEQDKTLRVAEAIENPETEEERPVVHHFPVVVRWTGRFASVAVVRQFPAEAI